MKRIYTYTIHEKNNNNTIKAFLEEQGYSHAVLVHLKQTEYGITLNGAWAYVTSRLHTGDTLICTLSEETSSANIVPAPLPLHIIYEDEDILIVDKPADMPVHPSLHNYNNTLANAVAWYYQSQGIAYTFRCINRLDRDTSGLVLLAKNMLSSAILSRQMVNREIRRTYLAIADGITKDSGTINAPIGRVSDSVITRCIDLEHGETAITHYQKIAVHPMLPLTLLALQLDTGRTHQIRVHMQSIGHPLIGDFLYHPDTTQIKRQALHSCQLKFRHPITKAELVFQAPLPADMYHIFPINEFSL